MSDDHGGGRRFDNDDILQMPMSVNKRTFVTLGEVKFRNNEKKAMTRQPKAVIKDKNQTRNLSGTHSCWV
jgi:hypothetical protein